MENKERKLVLEVHKIDTQNKQSFSKIMIFYSGIVLMRIFIFFFIFDFFGKSEKFENFKR